MLPKSRRLTRLEILQLKKSVSPKPSPLGLCYISSGPSKFAVIVSTKIAKHAVDRNQLRRKIYHALQPLPPTNHQLVLHVSKNSLRYSPSELTSLLQTLLT